jgi:hypothetical protein
MQANPEDYAFTCAYSPDRLMKQLGGLQRGLKMRLIMLGVIVGFAGYSIYQEAKSHELDFGTILALVFVGTSVVLVVVAQVLVSRAQPGGHGVDVAAMMLFVGFALLIGPPVLLLRVARNFTRYEVFAPLEFSATVIMIGVGVTLALLLAAGVSIALWRSSERESLGFVARRLASLAIATTLIAHVATGFFVAYLSGQVASLDIPPTVDMWYFQLFDDAAIWTVAVGLLLAFPLGSGAIAVMQMAGLAWTIKDIPVGPALRIDPAGLVVAAPHGAVRIVWDDVEMLSAQAHTSMPSHELVVRSDTGYSWKVPFVFLDSLPGTIDSAIRAATDNAWDLDVHRLNRVI